MEGQTEIPVPTVSRKLTVVNAELAEHPQAAAARRTKCPRREMEMERIAILEVDVRVAATGMRARRLIGCDVYNDEDEHIGTLDDLMIGDDRNVGFAILSVGGFLGIGSHLVAVTFDSLAIDDYRVVLPGATREELKRLPEFVYR